MTKLIINAETGETVERELSAEEIAQQEIDEANYLASKAIADAETEAKATQKAALLERLGITEDEARLLLG
jgi:vacuolar-type H+-ATPase subunit H